MLKKQKKLILQSIFVAGTVGLVEFYALLATDNKDHKHLPLPWVWRELLLPG